MIGRDSPATGIDKSRDRPRLFARQRRRISASSAKNIRHAARRAIRAGRLAPASNGELIWVRCPPAIGLWPCAATSLSKPCSPVAKAGRYAKPKKATRREPGQKRVSGQHEPRDPHPGRHSRTTCAAGRAAPLTRRLDKIDTRQAPHRHQRRVYLYPESRPTSWRWNRRIFLCRARPPRPPVIADAAKAKGLAVEVDGDAVPLWLRGDAVRLRQALLNYAGTIRISTRARTSPCAPPSPWTKAAAAWCRCRAGVRSPPDRRGLHRHQADGTSLPSSRRLGWDWRSQRLALLRLGETPASTARPSRARRLRFTAACGGAGIRAADRRRRRGGYRRRHAQRPLLLAGRPSDQPKSPRFRHAVHLAVDVALAGRDMVGAASAYGLILMGVPDTWCWTAWTPPRSATARRFSWRWPCAPPRTSGTLLTGAGNVLTGRAEGALGRPGLLAARHRSGHRCRRKCIAAPCRQRPKATTPGGAASPAVPGLDVARGLAVVRGNLSLYRRLLALFVDHHGDEVERLRERPQAGDLVKIECLAHTLQGTAGQLGAPGFKLPPDALQAAILHDAETGRH